MKTLQAFWHWVENEKPAAITTYAAREKTCTEVEMQAVDMALDAVYERTYRRWNDETWNEYAPALKALSLDFCAALERMHEQVPEPTPFAQEFLEASFPDCPRCKTKHDTLSSMIDCEASEKAENEARLGVRISAPGGDIEVHATKTGCGKFALTGPFCQALFDAWYSPSTGAELTTAAERLIDDARDVERLKFEDMYRTMPWSELDARLQVGPLRCERTYPRDPFTAEGQCDNCGRFRREHDVTEAASAPPDGTGRAP